MPQVTQFPEPTKEGLYLGRYVDNPSWHLVVEVTGDAPFLQLRIWDRSEISDRAIIEVASTSSLVWGPEIELPIISHQFLTERAKNRR